DAPAAAPPPRRRPRRAAVLGAGSTAAVLAVTGAFLLGGEVNDNDSNRAAQTTATLPAAAAQTVTAPTGKTQAGAIYANASPAVVSIRTSSGSGTGFLIDSEGTLVTNAHVVEDESTVTIRFGADGTAIRGTVAGSDPSSDLAVVHIDGASIPSGTTPLKLADSDKVAVGDTVVAIGNPFGLDRTETTGIVSGLERDIQAPNGFQISRAIQTDAAINPGNSGGPLLDDSGRVIGVNSQIETSGSSSGNVGVGFAVPSNSVRTVVPALKAGKTIERPWLGVSTNDTSGSTVGARIAEVVPGSPAAAAGLRAGDLITRFDDQVVPDSSSLSSIVEGAAVGDDVKIEVQRGGSSVELGATLRPRPAEAP
ncbi:MAG: S1C family serine protease, partial [Solirubrobacteraceae bacterium]